MDNTLIQYIHMYLFMKSLCVKYRKRHPMTDTCTTSMLCIHKKTYIKNKIMRGIPLYNKYTQIMNIFTQ